MRVRCVGRDFSINSAGNLCFLESIIEVIYYEIIKDSGFTMVFH